MNKRNIFIVILITYLFIAIKPALSANEMNQLAIFTGEAIDDQFANMNSFHPLTIADIDNDGYDDVITGARYHTPGGGVYIFRGKNTLVNTNAANADIILRDTLQPDTAFGESVSAGDIDYDGNLELVIGNYRYASPEDNAGATYLFKTGPTFTSKDASQANAMITGTYYRNSLGPVSVVIGDINGDNYEDFLVNGQDDMNVYLFYGSATLQNKSKDNADVTFTGCPLYQFIPKAEDINQDGYKDIIIGCLGSKTYVIYGGLNLSDMNLSNSDIILSDPLVGFFGLRGIATADFNKDGFIDIAVKGSKTVNIFYGAKNWTNKTASEADVIFSSDPA